MALAGPVGKTDMVKNAKIEKFANVYIFISFQNIAFRLQSKSQVFNAASNVLMNARLDLCASASSLGLVFVGSVNPEIIVLCLKDLEAPNATEQNAPSRRVPMPGPVSQIATNCDGSILAIEVNVNGTPQIQLYSVASFLTPVN